MRILLLTQYFPPDPDSSRGLPFAKWLQEHGHNVTVLTAMAHYSEAARASSVWRWRQTDTVDGIRVVRVGLYRIHDRSVVRRVVNYLTFAMNALIAGLPGLGRFDVIYVTSTPPTVGLPAWLTKKFKGTPYVFNIVDIWPEAVLSSGMLAGKLSGRVFKSAIVRLCRRVYGDADAVTTISNGYRDITVRQGFVASPGRVHVIYNSAPQAAIRAACPGSDVARRLGFAGKLTFLYAGNFGIYQGVRTFIAAAERLVDLPHVQIALAGTGVLEEELRDLIARRSLSNVKLLGVFDPNEMPEVYASADALLIHLRDLPFLRATVPGKTQIALAVGKPVIAAVAGESAEIVEAAKAGIVCRPENPEELANAIRQMAAMPPEERAAMGARGRRYYANHMSTEVTAPTLERILLDCVPRNRAKIPAVGGA